MTGLTPPALGGVALPAPSPAASLGLRVYARPRQSPVVRLPDEHACYTWAWQQTALAPMPASPPPPPRVRRRPAHRHRAATIAPPPFAATERTERLRSAFAACVVGRGYSVR